MTEKDVPLYLDPKGFVSNDNKYPCSTQYMVYDPMQHKYFLTEKCLNFHGIDVERRYISCSPNKIKEFIELVTDTVYDYIQYKVGLKNFQVMLYRIAVAPEQIYLDPYTFRKQFEKVLIIQAKYIIDNGVISNYSAYDLAHGIPDGKKPEDEFRDNLMVAPRAINKLESMGLTSWFSLAPFINLDTNKY
ncbi:MAG: hypothetical protein K2K60_03045 [Clostridia bacterium]|nr:hypothetical protein [Clostridia bacterium]